MYQDLGVIYDGIHSKGFPKGNITRWNIKLLVPAKSWENFRTNMSQIKLPEGVEESPTFNVTELYGYQKCGVLTLQTN